MSSSASRVALAGAAVVALAACGSDTPAADTTTVVPSEAIVLPEPTSSAPANPAADSVADLEVEDQYGNGRSVTVTSVILGRGQAWLAVSDLGGNVLGVKELSPRAQPVTVNLQPPVTMSQELLAALYLDDGDGSFDAKRDTLMVDEEGEPVSEDFDYIVQ